MRAAAVDAHQAGFSIRAMDHFGDADLRAVCDQWIHLNRTEDWDSAVTDRTATMVPTGGFDWPATDPHSHQGLIAFPSKPQFDAMRDPKVLAALARDADIALPITLQHDELANLDSATPNRWMIKPHAGTGGLGIRSIDSHEFGCAKLQLQPGEYLQQRIAGRPIGVNFISRCRDGNYQAKLLAAFGGLTHRKNRQHRWLYGGSIGPLQLQDTTASELRHKLEGLGDRIAQRFELVGLFNVDLILTPDRSLVMLEINPRYSASMELMPVAGHLIDCHIAAYQEAAGHIDRHQADQRFAALERLAGDKSYNPACKRIVYATRPTRFDVSVEELHEKARDLYQRHSIEVTYHDLPSTDEIIPSGYPILTVIARCQNTITPAPAKRLLCQTHRIAARIRKTLG